METQTPQAAQATQTASTQAKPPEADPAQATLNNEPAFVIFGLDDKRRPHASWFTAEDVEKAEHAADLMDMAIWHVRPDQRDLARRTQRAKVFASGKAFCPFVTAKLYAALEAAAGATDPLANPGEVENGVDEPQGDPGEAENGASEAAGGQKRVRTSHPRQKPSTGSGGRENGSGEQGGNQGRSAPAWWRPAQARATRPPTTQPRLGAAMTFS